MLINKTTGEIAFHALVWDENRNLRMEQYPLKKINEGDDIEFIDSFINAKRTQELTKD